MGSYMGFNRIYPTVGFCVDRKRTGKIHHAIFMGKLTMMVSIGSGWLLKNHLENYELVNGKDYPIYYGK